jgi:rRNA maturation protein Nop10
MKNYILIFLLSFLFVNECSSQRNKTFKVYVMKKNSKCNEYTLNVAGSKYVINLSGKYERTECDETKYRRLQKEKIPLNTEMILNGKAYMYDGTRVYTIDKINKTCGWPISEAEWFKLRGL